ncbi:hypothetical protein Tco_0008605 [Tanacetum coccineum]
MTYTLLSTATIMLKSYGMHLKGICLVSEYGEHDWKAVVFLYEYETFKAIKGELLLDTYIRYLQVINDLKKCGYKKDNCELNFKFLNNLQPEWKQYGTTMRQNKNLMDINIDALYNILKQDQGDVNEAMSHKKKAVVVTSDPFALVAEKTIVSKAERSSKAFNRKKYYVKPTNNNLRTSSASSLQQNSDESPEYVKVRCKMTVIRNWNEKEKGYGAKLCAYYCRRIEFCSQDYKKEVSGFLDGVQDSEESSSSAEETIVDVSYYTFDSKSKSEYETSEYYDNSTNYGVFVDNDDDQEIFHDTIIEPANVVEALKDVDWVSAMQDELDQVARLKVWRLVSRPKQAFIKTKWDLQEYRKMK